MKDAELKHLTKWVMEEVRKDNEDPTIFRLFEKISAQVVSDMSDNEFKIIEIPQLKLKIRSKKQFDYVVTELKEELINEFKNENSFLVTMRLIIALWEIDINDELMSSVKEYNPKIEVCCELAKRFNLGSETQEVLSLVGILDSLIKS